MSDTVKIIIEIPKPMHESVQNGTYCGTLYEELKNGVPLDDVKAEILDYNVRRHVSGSESFLKGYAVGMDKSAEILDNIGKGE